MTLLRCKGDYVMFHCPACKHAHVVTFQNHTMPWSWNGNIERPTITPSLKISECSEKGEPIRVICHLNVTDGMLVYHIDSSHEFAGKTIPMVDWPE